MGPKIIVGNHPMVWDVFPCIVMVKLILSLTNQVKMNRGVESMQSLRESLAWLKSGDSLVVGPEGERTSVTETREATRGIVWLAVKAKVPLIPIGVWISEEDLYPKEVRYHFKNRSYTIESYFPRFRGRYFLLVGEEIKLDRYYGKRMSPKERQEIADTVLDTIYQLRAEAKQICENSR
jgi:1-acyl-sn-glycerol-3-phosphate acyltransferase